MIFRFILGLLVLLFIGTSTWLYTLYIKIENDVYKVVNYNPKQSTQFFDKNGKLIANIFKGQNREYVKYNDIPARIIESLIAIEDTQYFEHFGVNPDAISRAIIKDIKAGAFVEGASTLTQQLIKMIVLTREKKIIRKIKEAMLAIKLETMLTKEEILERYLNHVYFGHGYYGIKTASKGYFKKDLYELSLKEMAILVGLPRAPSFYDPTRNLKVSLARANQVITRLNTLGWINENQYKNAIKETPVIYDQTLTKNKAPYVIDYVLKKLKKDIPNIRSGGYKINLTIDLDAQNIAKEGLKKSYEEALKRDQNYRKNENSPDDDSFVKKLNGALVSIENNTGKILAIVGGVDYSKSMFNRAVQANRQPGSAIKPFIYQTGLNQGLNPASKLVDISRTYEYTDKEGNEQKWQPRNYGGKFKGFVTLRESLVKSRNLSTVNLVTNIGIGTTYNALKSYGFEGIPRDLSITLGAMSVSPLELSQYYSVFSNHGVQVKPYIIQSIIDKDRNKTIFGPETKKINSPEQTYLITSILNETVNRGTGRRARVKNIDLAGKTGTTNNNIDAWFCGYSPTIQTIVWFGNDNNTPMRESETGGIIAAPVFSHFYEQYLKIHPEIARDFEIPNDKVYKTKINGKVEYYTETSPLPNIDVEVENKIEF
ncbi:MAG: transglycosylase domain-containing protein [Campylobacterota bacterium]